MTMYRVQHTESAHANVPDRCWLDGSRHRTIEAALKAERRFKLPAPPGAWSNNTRVVDDATGDPITREQRMDVECSGETRGPGRPRTNPPQTRVSWQLDAEVVAALDAEARETNLARKTLVEGAVRLALPHRFRE